MSFKTKALQHTATAADVTAGSVEFDFGDFGCGNGHLVQVRTSAGVIKAWDGAAVQSGAKITVDNTGVTDFAATDVIAVIAW